VLTHFPFPVSSACTLISAACKGRAGGGKVVSAQREAVIWWDRQGWDLCHREVVANEGTTHGS